MPVFTTRGCVYDCKYCSVTKFFGRTFRFKPISSVIEEIESVNADSYFFVDDNIGCFPEYSEELFKSLIKKNIRWFSQASTQLANHPDLINLAAKAGCRSLFFGIESISSKNLKSVRKGFNDPEKYLELADRIERTGIRPWFSIILGFDHDDPEQLRLTVEFLKKAKILNIVLFILTPLPGTELYSEMNSANRIFDKDWTKYDTWHVVYQPKHFAPDQLEREYWRIYTELYSPRSILRKISKQIKKPHINFSGLYNDIRIQIYTHSQLRRYEHPFSMGIGRCRQAGRQGSRTTVR